MPNASQSAAYPQAARRRFGIERGVKDYLALYTAHGALSHKPETVSNLDPKR